MATKPGCTLEGLPSEPLAALRRLLDVLSQTPGAILYRGPDRWQALEPGNVGDILELDENRLPRWRTPD